MMSTEGQLQKKELNDIGHSRKQNFYTESSGRPLKRTPTDFFIVTTEKSRDNLKRITPEQKREHFVRERPKSITKLFYRSQKHDRQKTREENKSKFASIVSKHLLPFRFVTSLKSKSKGASAQTDLPSCQSTSNRKDLCHAFSSDQESIEDSNEFHIDAPQIVLATPTRTCPITDDYAEKNVNTANLFNNKQKRVQHLPIPVSSTAPKERFSEIDIFTTSFTRSIPLNTVNKLSKNQCKSAQDLPKSPSAKIKQKIIRSFSDTPARFNLGIESTKHIPFCLQSKMYRNDNISQILDYLFIGSIEAAYNEPQLCRLKIESLVDMSNMTTAQVPAFKKLHCPCLCSQSTHFRSRLIVRVEDKDTEDIEQYFSEINKFIDGAKRCGKKVLIFSYCGKSRAPAAAIQYLMNNENFLLRQAYNLLKNHRSVVDINQGFQEALETQERRLFPAAKPSISFSNEYLNIADPQAIKCAWVDCTDM